MGHTPESRARAYEKIKKRRLEWLKTNGPCPCGSWEKLEVDHVDPSQKIHHAVWSWSDISRNRELAKCQVLCSDCHKKKTYEQNYAHLPKHGVIGYRKGCRCTICKTINSARVIEWRLRKFGSKSSANKASNDSIVRVDQGQSQQT